MLSKSELDAIRVMCEEDQVSLFELARQLPALLGHIDEQGAKIERLRELLRPLVDSAAHDLTAWDRDGYTCRRCGARGLSRAQVVHEADCAITKARAALKEAQGE